MTRAGPASACSGTSALLFEAPGETELSTQRRIWSLAREAETWPEVREAVPGINNLLVSFAEPPRRLEAAASRGSRRPGRRRAARARGSRRRAAGRLWRGGRAPHGRRRRPYGARRRRDRRRSIQRRSIRSTRSAAIPGYCYLGGMDPRIATPRRKVPVLRSPAAPSRSGARRRASRLPTGPSGWNTIGTTSMTFFDADARSAGPAAARRQHRLPGRWGDPMIEVLSRARSRPCRTAAASARCAGVSAPPAPWTGMALACGNLLLGNEDGAAGDRGPGLSLRGAVRGRVALRRDRGRLRRDAGRRAASALVGRAAAGGAVLRLGLPAGRRWRGCAGLSLRRRRYRRACRARLPRDAVARRHRRPGRPHAAAGRPLAVGSRPPSGAGARRPRPRAARARAAPRERRHAGRAGPPRRRIRVLHAGLARRVLGASPGT